MAITAAELDQLKGAVSESVKRQVEDILRSVEERQAESLKTAAAQQRDYAGELQRGALGGEPVKRSAAETTRGIGRMLRAIAAGRGDPERAAAFANKEWGDAAVVKALGVQDSAAGGFLVPDDWSADIIEFLRPATVVRRANPETVDMPNGTMNIPRLTGGSTASYIGENQNLALSGNTFGAVRLSWKKLGAVIPISNDLLRARSANADSIIRNDLVRAMAQAEDLNFLRSDGSQFAPKGLKYWTPSTNTTTSAGSTLANMITDLSVLQLYLLNANVAMLRPHWFMSPRTMMAFETIQNSQGNYVFRDEMTSRGTLWGIPFATTTQIPINLSGTNTELYLVDMADAVIGEATNLIIDASNEAAYYDGANVQSAWSQDQTSIRAIARHDFAMRHDQSVAYLSSVAY